MARLEALQAKGAGEGELRSPDDSRGPKPQAPAGIREQRPEESGAGGCPPTTRSRPSRALRSSRASREMHLAPNGTFFNTLDDSTHSASCRVAA